MSNPVISGSCLCGQVTYQIDGKVSGIIHCHCETCRKAHGSAFSSVAAIPDKSIVISGEEHLSSYESSSGKHRFFCKQCGTQVYAKRDGADHIILRLGSIDSELSVKELAHTWLSDKAGWYDINASIPQFDRAMPRP